MSNPIVKPPAFMICPISQEVFIDPVMSPRGNYYEKAAITKWLRDGHRTSPMTNQPLNEKQLAPNLAMRKVVKHWQKQNKPIVEVAAESKNEVASPLSLSKVVQWPSNNGGGTVVEITTPSFCAPTKRLLVLVIDTSYSMQADATKPTNSGEVDGFSCLDIVKHASTSVVATLPNDAYVAIVKFSNDAHIIQHATLLDYSGRLEVSQSIARLQPDGNTNIYDGVYKGYTLADRFLREFGENALANVMLLTDGVPNRHPVGQTETQATTRLIKNNSTLRRAPLQVFGFGPGTELGLCTALADIGGGSFSYVSSADMVGNVFVRRVAQFLTTVATNVTVKIGNGPSASHKLGVVHGGQSRTLVVPHKAVDGVLTFHYGTGDDVQVVPITDANESNNKREDDAMSRLALVSVLNQMIQAFGRLDAQEALRKGAVNINDIRDLDNVMGQLKTAVSQDDYWQSWGLFYVQSLLHAHLACVASNFKDQSVVRYQFPEFDEIVSRGDEAFAKLPPPFASNAARARQSGRRVVDVDDMSCYNDVDAGCWTLDTPVVLSPVRTVRAGDVKVNDVVRTPNGCVAFVLFIVESTVSQDVLVDLGDNVVVTQYHPVRPYRNSGSQSQRQGGWVRPAELEPLGRNKWRQFEEDKVEDEQEEETKQTRVPVVTFMLGPVLEGNDGGHVEHVVRLGRRGEIDALTLGHGREDVIAKHALFGDGVRLMQEFTDHADANGRVQTTGVVRRGKDAIAYNYA